MEPCGTPHLTNFLKGRIVQPPKTGLKCTSAAAPTLQQTVACTILPFNQKQYHVHQQIVRVHWDMKKMIFYTG